jgi:hypothetical protein
VELGWDEHRTRLAALFRPFLGRMIAYGSVGLFAELPGNCRILGVDDLER